MVTNVFLKEFNRLNDAQREAVETIEGPVMVVAGPGTGKTQILAMRIANILKETQVDAGNILALTFTNSGVWAMKKRLLEIIGPESYKIHVHTFHSFCNEVIQNFPEKFIFSDRLSQLNDLDQILIIRDILKQNKFKLIKPLKSPYYYQAAILEAIRKLKQENIEPTDFRKIISKEIVVIKNLDDLKNEKGQIKTKYTDLLSKMDKNLELATAYELYQKTLTKKGVYDYADMIVFVAERLKKDKTLLSFYQEKFQYILVDEYQDTNSAQNEVVRLLAKFYKDPNLFVVGDDEQSIYRFQGAALENILGFVKNYPRAKIIILKDNYRSGQNILDASRAVISHNKHQIFSVLKADKNLISRTDHRDSKIFFANFANNMVEDFFIVEKIKKFIRSGVKPAEIACIYKEHKDGDNLAELLSKSKVSFSQNNSENVLDDPDILKIISLLNAINNPYNGANLFEVMNLSFLKLNQLDIYRTANLASQRRQDLFDMISSKEISFQNEKQMRRFHQLILESSSDFHNKTFSLAFENLINKSGYLGYLLSLPDAPIKLNRLKSFFDEIKLLNTKNKSLNLKTFLQFIRDLQENNLRLADEPMDADLDSVKLLTAHQAKGLEFEYVFIMHLTDNRWGSPRKKQLFKLPDGLLKNQTTLPEAEEEERRLFYVALTRAKREVYLTSALHYRENSLPDLPSKFLAEIPGNLLTKINIDRYEKQFVRRLKSSLMPAVWRPAKEMKNFLETLTEKFVLNSTAFNAYLLCPKQFFFDHLLRVPKVKNYSLAYGSAAHFALEKFFKKQQRELKLPSKKFLLQEFKTGLNREILSLEDYERGLKQAKVNLGQYFDYYENAWRKVIPLAMEYNFGYRNVHFGDVQINGKIDKIEFLDKPGRLVKIIDYKTSRPKTLNYLLGLTSDQDESYLNQAYFYKLLTESDPLFKEKVKEIEFDFLTPEKGKFKKISLPIDQKKFEAFKEKVDFVYKKIRALDFAPCSTHKKPLQDCPYKNICDQC